MKDLITGAIAKHLPSLVPGISSFLNPWVLLGVVAAAGVCFGAGVRVEGWHRDAALKSQAEADAKVIAAFYARDRVQNQESARRLAEERAARAQDRKDFEEKLQNAKSTELVEQPSQTGDAGNGLKAPDGGVYLSAVGLMRWNDALAVGVSKAERGGWLDAANASPGAVEIKDAYRNLNVNAELLGECRARELQWQLKACKSGWWSGSECKDLK